MPEDKFVAIDERVSSTDGESESDSDDVLIYYHMKAVLGMTAVVMLVNWMEQSHLFKRQQEVNEKLVIHDTPIL